MDRSVIMTGGSIPAILAGVKTRTRRMPNRIWARLQPGDRLWVREAWRSWDETHEVEDDDGGYDVHEQTYVAYRATPRVGLRTKPTRETIWYLDESSPIEQNPNLIGPWRPSLHMPRWASRITLLVTAVRSEPLTDITEDEAIAEGVMMWPDLTGHLEDVVAGRARARFAELWDSLHGDGQWATNPVVRVISFEKQDQR